MSHPELFILGTLRALFEVALLFLLGRGILALLAGQRRHANAIYRLFAFLTAPVLQLMRKISPPQILDRHLPFVAFCFMFWGWIALAWLKKIYCDTHFLQCF